MFRPSNYSILFFSLAALASIVFVYMLPSSSFFGVLELLDLLFVYLRFAASHCSFGLVLCSGSLLCDARAAIFNMDLCVGLV